MPQRLPLPPEVRAALQRAIGTTKVELEPLGGGHEHAVYRAGTATQACVLKLYPHEGYARAEAGGLSALASTGAVRTPAVLDVGPCHLIMEWIPPSGRIDWEAFAGQLAALHRQTASSFGWPEANFIGPLPQPNERRCRWADFFASQRLEPQIQLAHARGALSQPLLRELDRLLEQLEAYLDPDEVPALVHGDLWRGNVLAAPGHGAVLIDPAVAYASREVDLAFSEMFGGFPEAFYRTYQEAFPLPDGYARRKALLNLYYLLVHVNLFGGTYATQVTAVLRQLAANG